MLAPLGDWPKTFFCGIRTRAMHCMLYYVDQSAIAVRSRNELLSDEYDCWFENVLLVWANND